MTAAEKKIPGLGAGAADTGNYGEKERGYLLSL